MITRKWFLVAYLYISVAPVCWAQTRADVKAQFVQEICQSLFGQNAQFKQEPEGRGWRGVALAMPGTPIEALSDAYSELPSDLLRTLAYSEYFDRVGTIHDGMFFPTERPLASVWENLIERTRPSSTLKAAETGGPTWAGWLFRLPDDIERARGVQFLREPSEYYLKYREFEDLDTVLEASRRNDLWRTNPRLSKYVSWLDAKNAVMFDWQTFGYKEQVEAALEQFKLTSLSEAYREWSIADSDFHAYSVIASQGARVPLTILNPPATSWPQLGSWTHLISRVQGTPGAISFELQHVAVIRPWLDISVLLEGKVALQDPTGKNAGYLLSDGTEPTFNSSPRGNGAVYIEELLLVRNIKAVGTQSPPPLSSHPLSVFAYPDSINLLGYIVRILPRFPN